LRLRLRWHMSCAVVVVCENANLLIQVSRKLCPYAVPFRVAAWQSIKPNPFVYPHLDPTRKRHLQKDRALRKENLSP
jgi:hypothetical protein